MVLVTIDIYTLSLHDALPISLVGVQVNAGGGIEGLIIGASAGLGYAIGTSRVEGGLAAPRGRQDRKSTRLNSSHLGISYAVFCLKKKYQIVVIRQTIVRSGRS